MPASERVDQTPVPRIVLFGALAVALLAFGIFLRTLHPGVGPSIDSLELHTAALVGGVIHPPGSPQYLMLGHLAMKCLPGASPAYRLNLFSALCAAATIGVTHLLTYRLTRSLSVSTFASLMLALSPRLWYQASVAELYALNALYVALVMYLLITWHQTRKAASYWAATALYALSFGNHVGMILLLPAFIYVVEVTDRAKLFRPRNLLITAGIVILAAMQYLYIPLRAATYPPFCNYCPGPIPSRIDYVTGPLFDYLTGGPFKAQIFGLARREVLARLPDSIGAWNRQFMPWGYALGVIGAWELFQRQARTAWLLLIGLVAEYLFVMTYDIPDWHDFMTPCYVIFTPLLGYGALRLWRVIELRTVPGLLERGLTRAGQVVTAALGVLAAMMLGIAFYTNLPLIDQSEKTEFDVNGHVLLEHAGPGAWLLMPHPNASTFYYSWALRYISYAEDLPPGLVVITPPEVYPPPGPSPYYEAWADVAPQLEGDAILETRPQLFVLDPHDERARDWGLLPICTPHGESIAGYEVVAVRVDGEIVPLVGAGRWDAIHDSVIFGDEDTHCED